LGLPLTQNQTVIIDDADRPLVSGYSWYAVECNGKFYPQAKEPGTNQPIYLHRYIMGAGADEEVDHRNGDSLNFRHSNLRVCDSTGNNRNVGKRAGLSSRYKGVHWHKAMDRWQAKINVDGRGKHLGYFHDEMEAARAYEEASLRLHGEFGRRNFPKAA